MADHFLQLGIHPGYLAEFEHLAGIPANSPTPDSKLHEIQTVAPPPRAGHEPIDYFAFVLSFLGFILSVITAVLYFNRQELSEPPKIELQDKQSDTRIIRLDESVRQLGLALGTVISRIEQQPGNTIAPLGPLLEVMAPKANLRIAPRKDASAVMAISAGTRLLAHDQLNDWFQVYAPSGELLWISESVISRVRLNENDLVPIQ
jgi:hypothetical protein